MMDDPAASLTQNDVASVAALMPTRRLSLGVTGHRLDRLGVDNIPALTLAIDALLAQISDAAGTGEPCTFRLVSGLAEGADCILADAAIRQGWQLDVVLPFFRDDYATDFASGPAQADYQRHLAAAVAVMELPGDRAEPGASGAAYERAGRIVLAQSDILIALWDGGPARGRGGGPQIVAEAVLRGIPVIHVDPAGRHAPLLLWDGLDEVDLGQQTVDTVSRRGLDALPGVVRGLLDPPADAADSTMLARFEHGHVRRWTMMIAYPLLLGVMGVRRPRLSDVRRPALAAAALPALCSGGGRFATQLRDRVTPRFARADATASRTAQVFRSVYVTNFALAAFAVVLSLLGLALPPEAKPVLITLELATIGTILLLTRTGNRARWHRIWLDNRALAERLRCLAIAAQLGDLDLRAGGDRTPGWVDWYSRATAREVGLPSARVDDAYLRQVQHDLSVLIDGQTAYLGAEAHQMHRLEHRLHSLGTMLFGVTALTCLGLLGFKVAEAATHALEPMAHPLAIAATIISAALPAIGAAIYGIRMQGDFAGTAERSHALAERLSTLRAVIADDALDFDTLSRRTRRVADLLTDDLANWFQTYHARPLVLPG